MYKSMADITEQVPNEAENCEAISNAVNGGKENGTGVDATWKSLFAFTQKSHLLALGVGLILSTAAGIVVPAFSLFLGRVFAAFTDFGDGKLDGHGLMHKVSYFAICILGLGGISWLLNGGFFLAWLVFGELQARNARDQLFDSMLKKDMAWYETKTAGISASIPRQQTQIRELQSATSQPLGFATQYCVTLVAALSLAFYTAWSVTLVTISALPVTVLMLTWLSGRIQSPITQQFDHLTQASKHAVNAIQSIDTVKYYNGQEYEVRKYADAIRMAAKYYLTQARLNALEIGIARATVLTMFVQGFWYGSHLIETGAKNPGQVLTAFWACLMASQSIEQLLPYAIVLEKGKAAASILEATLIKIEKGQVISSMNGNKCPRFCEGDIEIRNIFFAYPSRPGEFVLKHATMSFPAGETTFIIGKSGSGKSTIGNLLLRFYNANSGDIIIDGESIQTLDIKWLRNNITLVQQSSTLFNDTIFNNIAFGKRKHQTVRAEEVRRWADFAALTETIDGLPQGVHTVVGSGGNAMSGGQKQRVAIARARLRNTPILILDEATSALDHVNRTLVMDAVKKWRRNKTTIIITHDISQIARDDYVYVLQDGCVAQEGYRYTLEQVLDGPFVTLVRPAITLPPTLMPRPTSGYSRSPTRLLRSSTAPTTSSLLSRRLSTANTAIDPSFLASPQPSQTLPSRGSTESTDTLNIQISTRSQRRVSQLTSLALPRQMNNLRNSFRNSAAINRQNRNQLNVPLLGPGSQPPYSPLSPLDEVMQERRDHLSALSPRPKTFRLPGRGSGLSDSPFAPVITHMQRMSNARLSMLPLRSPLFSPSSLRLGSSPSPIELEIMDYPLLPDRAFLAPSKPRRHRRQPSSLSHISAELRDTVLKTFPFRKQRPGPHVSEARKLSSMKEILGTVWPRLTRRQRLMLLGGFGSAAVTAAATPVFSWVLSKLLGTFHAKNASGEAMTWSLVLLGVAIIDAASSYAMHYLLETCGQAWVDSLRTAAVERIIDQPRSWFDGDRNSTSSLVDCLDRNAEEMRNLLGRFAGFVFVGALMMAIAITWSLITSWKLTLVGLSTAPFVYAVTRGFEVVNAKWEAKSNDAGEVAAAIFAETFGNIRTVRALTLESHFHKKHADATKAAYKVGIVRAAYSGLFFGISDSVVLFVTALIVYYGSVLVASHQHTIEDITLVFSELLFSIAHVNAIVAFIPQINSSRDTASRLLRLSSLPYKASHEHVGQEPIQDALPISISRLNFAYSSRPTARVLQDFTLSIHAGTFTCLVGSSGSGKSTLASLLLGLYHCPSTALEERWPAITMASKDIRTLHIPTLRKLVVLVPQSPVLFPASARDNIIYGIEPESPLTCEPSLIHTAARMAGIHDFIMTLPHGYETPLGDGGLGVSGGQAQRIGIARALVRKPQVLILDEPTSALDAANAADIRTMLRDLVRKEHVAVVCITHDPEMMKAADRVVLLEQGRVVEEGTWSALTGHEGGKLREMMG